MPVDPFHDIRELIGVLENSLIAPESVPRVLKKVLRPISHVPLHDVTGIERVLSPMGCFLLLLHNPMVCRPQCRDQRMPLTAVCNGRARCFNHGTCGLLTVRMLCVNKTWYDSRRSSTIIGSMFC